MLDYLSDDLDNAIHFLAAAGGTLLRPGAGTELRSWGTTVRFSQRLDREGEHCRAEMHRHPRYRTALFAHEAQELPVTGFLAGAEEVQFLEEERACTGSCCPEQSHRGCELLDGELPRWPRSYNSCLACGRGQGAAQLLLYAAEAAAGDRN